MKLKGNDTIKDICPAYESFTRVEQLSLFYNYLVFLNDGDYDLAEFVFSVIMMVSESIIEIYSQD